MIRHCVMLDVPSAAIKDLEVALRDLETLTQNLPGISGFVAGPNRDFEGKTPGYSYGFTLDAEDAAALQSYADDPAHQAIGRRLVALCSKGVDGILVYDLEAAI